MDEKKRIAAESEAFEKDMKADMDGIYDLKAFPENYEVKKKFGFKISGDDLDYINAAGMWINFFPFSEKVSYEL